MGTVSEAIVETNILSTNAVLRKEISCENCKQPLSLCSRLRSSSIPATTRSCGELSPSRAATVKRRAICANRPHFDWQPATSTSPRTARTSYSPTKLPQLTRNGGPRGRADDPSGSSSIVSLPGANVSSLCEEQWLTWVCEIATGSYSQFP